MAARSLFWVALANESNLDTALCVIAPHAPSSCLAWLYACVGALHLLRGGLRT